MSQDEEIDFKLSSYFNIDDMIPTIQEILGSIPSLAWN